MILKGLLLCSLGAQTIAAPVIEEPKFVRATANPEEDSDVQDRLVSLSTSVYGVSPYYNYGINVPSFYGDYSGLSGYSSWNYHVGGNRGRPAPYNLYTGNLYDGGRSGGRGYQGTPVGQQDPCADQLTCDRCTQARGCVWGGSTCYTSRVPLQCTGCANLPHECPRGATVIGTGSACRTCLPAWLESSSQQQQQQQCPRGQTCVVATSSSCYGQCQNTPTTTDACDAFNACLPCTQQRGCLWSGTRCYYGSTACTNAGCANYPNQCPSAPDACEQRDCTACTEANGCVWSGTRCYYAVAACTNAGCANYPHQCPVAAGCGAGEEWDAASYQCVPVTCQAASACPAGQACVDQQQRRCFQTPCRQFTCQAPVDVCAPHSDCLHCAAQSRCIWSSAANMCYYSAAPCSGAACANFPSECPANIVASSQGCADHLECAAGDYCFSCSICLSTSPASACGVCGSGSHVPGSCGPGANCMRDRDSVDGSCPPTPGSSSGCDSSPCGSMYMYCPNGFQTDRVTGCSLCQCAY